MPWTYRLQSYAGFLFILVVACALITVAVAQTIQRAILIEQQARTVRLVQGYADQLLQHRGFDIMQPTHGVFTSSVGYLGEALESMQFEDIAIFNPAGRIVWSSAADRSGQFDDADPAFWRAAAGETTATYVDARGVEGPGTLTKAGARSRSYIPLRIGVGPVLGVIAVTADLGPEMSLIRRAQLLTSSVVLIGFGVFWVALWRYTRTVSRGSQRQVREIHRQALELRRRSMDTFRVLAAAVEARDPYTIGHSERVAALSVHLGRAVGLSARELATLRIAALMHDIGKIGVKERILEKPGPVTAEEYQQIKRHSEIGARLLGEIRPVDPELTLWVRHHHERIDGTGYPDGLKGTEIPVGARIIALADCYDAMRSWRPYRAAMTLEQAAAELRRAAGTQFDEQFAAALLAEFDAVEPLYTEGAGAVSGWQTSVWAHQAVDEPVTAVPGEDIMMADWAMSSGWRARLVGALVGLVTGMIMLFLFRVFDDGKVVSGFLITLSAAAGWLVATIVQRLLYVAARDGLTGLIGYRQFHHLLARTVSRAARGRDAVSLLLFDVDDFKIVNDQLGHAIGDRVLAAIAAALHDGVRPGDTVARLGGDEFAILMPGANEQAARSAVARLKERVSAGTSGLRTLLGALEISMSIGVVTHQPPESAQQFLNRADQDMYRGKRAVRMPVDRTAALR